MIFFAIRDYGVQGPGHDPNNAMAPRERLKAEGTMPLLSSERLAAIACGLSPTLSWVVVPSPSG